MNNERLMEAIADIALYVGHEKYTSGDSRRDVSEIIRWAEEFENAHKYTNWNEEDYILTVDAFAERKLNEALQLQSDYSN